MYTPLSLSVSVPPPPTPPPSTPTLSGASRRSGVDLPSNDEFSLSLSLSLLLSLLLLLLLRYILSSGMSVNMPSTDEFQDW